MEMNIYENLVVTRFNFQDKPDHLELTYNGLIPDELTDDFTKHVSGYIVRRLSETNQTNVRFFLSGEGLPLNPLLFSSQIVRCLVEDFKVPHHCFMISSGAAPTLTNILYYNRHVKTYDLERIKILFWNGYENSASRVQLFRVQPTYDPYYDKFDTTPRIKEKLFLSYNRNTSRIHRLYLGAEVIRRNLLDRAFFSLYLGGVNPDDITDIAGEIDYHWLHAHNYIPKSYKHIRQTLVDNIGLFPIRLNLRETDLQPFHIDDDLHYYNNSYFSVVTETKFFADVAGVYDTQLDCHLFSEKTYKPILGKHPFIHLGIPGSLRVLRESGYRTFHPFIDETYDTVENDEARLETIMDEIERLSKFTDDQWLEWQRNVQSIVEHNFNVLKDYRPTCLTY